ncbi:branched-chain amino acid transport system II carrier protein [Sporosarcina ureilytica]|uniref:Branched-chain amino acid transport system carrier protein n=1 Tax=Sporosarcina ureilytica TaxID=298596 RepID=A0A1D8JKM0_9BACL|nr:branched-chain amino acid transport system II carrier protein [Sporosarcina ureilytica]AOV09257.1 branched-chain amino acid transport system II carrier protein [Sporosarcina ureilytica]
MLFALFLGAGNIIFPPALGQMAGNNLVIAMLGFLITGVGLPLVAVLAIANSNTGESGGLQSIASRVHPAFGVVFTMIIYMAIGPFFGIPRTATVSYEIGIVPFLTNNVADSSWPLLLFTIVFFTITVALALNPAKLVDRIGKILTPILFIIIGALVIKSLITPMGSIQEAHGDYAIQPFFRSFVEGYLTMDVIAALVFGIIIINALKVEGITKKGPAFKATIIAGIIAAVGLTLVYVSLGYIGATSVDAIGLQDNGGAILALASKYLYGSAGTTILALTIIFACLTTSIGLVSACAQYFEETFPQLSYKVYVFLFAGFSTIIGNFGLTQLIQISIPVLMMVYPLAIVLMMMSFIDKSFGRKPIVYILALLGTAVISVFDGLKVADIDVKPVTSILSHLPLYEQQIGWLLPAIVGALIGIIISQFTPERKHG